MPANNEDNGFRKLLGAIFQDQKSYWNPENRDWPPSKKAMEIKGFLSKWGWREIDEKLLETVLDLKSENINFSKGGLILFLPPLEKETKDFVPAISVEYQNGTNCFSLRSIMITAITTCRPRRYPAIGFRIDSPHKYCQVLEDQKDDEKRHDFYHAQLINNFGYGPMIESLEWLPITQPSFPLYANCPIDAVHCLILTLYGGVYYKNFIRRHSTKNLLEHTSKPFKEFCKTYFS